MKMHITEDWLRHKILELEDFDECCTVGPFVEQEEKAQKLLAEQAKAKSEELEKAFAEAQFEYLLRETFSDVFQPKKITEQICSVQAFNPRQQEVMLLKLIRHSMNEILQNSLFELNDKITRKNITDATTEYLATLPLQDYVVVCDESNNSQDEFTNIHLDVNFRLSSKGFYLSANTNTAFTQLEHFA